VELQSEAGLPEPASAVHGTNLAGWQEGHHAEDLLHAELVGRYA